MLNPERLVAVEEDVRLAVWTRPAATGAPTYLLVHGLASNARLWDGVVAELDARGCGSVVMDLRGHGRSDKPSRGFDFETMANDLRVVVEDAGLGRVIVVGQSFGANLAIELAGRHPEMVTGVGCVDGGFIDLSSTFPSWDEAAERLAPPHLEGTSFDTLRTSMVERLSDWPPAGVAAQLENFEVRTDATIRPWLARQSHMELARALWAQDPRAAVSLVRVPIVVIACRGGSPDKEAQVEALADAGADVNVHWVDAHHDVHAQHPDLVARLLRPLEDR